MGDRPKTWAKWLPLAELWYNTSSHSATKLSPNEAVYGQPPPKLISFIPRTTRVPAVDEALKSRDEISNILQQNLKESQGRMKKFENHKKTEREFEVGNQVYLKFRPYHQMTTTLRWHQKLAVKFMGHTELLAEWVMWRTCLICLQVVDSPSVPHFPSHETSGELITIRTILPPIIVEGTIQAEPKRIVDRRLKRKGRCAGGIGQMGRDVD